MPRYDFQCVMHGTYEQWMPSESISAVCPICGKPMTRLFNTQVQFCFPTRMQDTNSDNRLRLREHNDSPAIKAKRDAGILMTEAESEVETARTERQEKERYAMAVEAVNEFGRANPLPIGPNTNITVGGAPVEIE